MTNFGTGEYGNVAAAIDCLMKAYDEGKLHFETRDVFGRKTLIVKGDTYEGRAFFKLAGFNYRGKSEGCDPQWRLTLKENNVYAMSTLAAITHNEKVFQIGSILGSPAYALNIK